MFPRRKGSRTSRTTDGHEYHKGRTGEQMEGNEDHARRTHKRADERTLGWTWWRTWRAALRAPLKCLLVFLQQWRHRQGKGRRVKLQEALRIHDKEGHWMHCTAITHAQICSTTTTCASQLEHLRSNHTLCEEQIEIKCGVLLLGF